MSRRFYLKLTMKKKIAFNKSISTVHFGVDKLLNVIHCTPFVPRATKLNPNVEPTMLCVPEIGNFKNVATSSHRALLASADTKPSISSVSESVYRSTSKIPLRIVSDTL